jgi:hypothetical protein
LFVVEFEKAELPPREFWRKGSKSYLEMRSQRAHFR